MNPSRTGRESRRRLPSALKMAGIVCLTAAGLWLLWNLHPWQPAIESFAKKQFALNLHGTVTWSTLAIIPPASVRITGLRFVSLDNDTLARIGATEARFRLIPLLWLHVSIPSLSLHDVETNYRTKPRQNLGSLFTPRPVPGPVWSVEIGRIAIDSGRVDFRDSTNKVTVRLRGIAARGHLVRTTDLLVRFTSPGGDLHVKDRNFGLDSFGLTLGTDARTCTLDDFVVAVDRHASLAGAFSFPYDSLREFSAQLSADADNAFFESLNVAQWGLSRLSRCSGTFTAAGVMQSPRLGVSLDVRNAVFRGASIDSLFLALTRNSDGVIHCRANAGGGGTSGVVTLSAAVPGMLTDPSKSSYQVHGRASIADILELLPRSAKRSAGSLLRRVPANLDFSASGPALEEMPGSVRATCSIRSALTAQGKPVPPVTVDFHYDHGVIGVSGGSRGGLQIDGHGTYKDSTLDLDASLRIDSLRALCSLLLRDSVDGSLSATAWFRHSAGVNHATITTSASAVSWRGLTVDTAAASLSYDGKVFTIVDARGTVAGPIRDALTAMGIDRVGGNVRATISARGPVAAPLVDGRFSISALTAGKPGTAIADSITGTIALRDSILTAGDMVLVKDSLLARGMVAYDIPARQVSGSWRFLLGNKARGPAGGCSLKVSMRGDSIGEGVVVVDSFPVKALRVWIASIPATRVLCSATASFSGHAANPRAEAFVAVMDTSVRGPLVTARATLLDHGFAARCTLSATDSGIPLVVEGTGRLTSSWALDTAGLTPVVLRVTAERLDLSPWARLSNAGIDAGGLLNADLTLTMRRNVWSAGGMASVSSGRFAWPGKNIAIEDIALTMKPRGGASSADVSLSTGAFTIGTASGEAVALSGQLTPKILTIDEARIRTTQGILRANGEIPLIGGESIPLSPDFHLSVLAKEFSLTIVNQVVEGWRFTSGTVDGNADITGTADGLRANGLLKGTKMVIEVDDFTPSMGPLDATVRLQDDALVLERLAGSWGGGTLAGNGSLQWTSRGFAQGRMQASAHGLSFSYAEENDIRIDTAHIVLERTRGRWRIGGSVLLGESRLVQKVAFNAPDPAAPPSSAETTAEGLALDVTLKAPQNLYVDIIIGQILTVGPVSSFQATCGGALTIGGTTARPSFTGQVTVIDGTVMYLDRLFHITRGIMSFAGGSEVNPYVLLTAVTSIHEAQGGAFAMGDSLTITLRIMGELADPVLSLQSAPTVYSEAEIINLLTFGQASLDNTGAGMLGNRASSILSQTVSFYASAQGRKLLGLDQVTVTGDILQADTSGEKTTVTVSKRIGSAVTVTYKGLVSSLKDQSAMVSWKILPFLFLDGESNVAGNAGLDIKVKVKK